jgi:hypothetical protein
VATPARPGLLVPGAVTERRSAISAEPNEGISGRPRHFPPLRRDLGWFRTILGRAASHRPYGGVPSLIGPGTHSPNSRENIWKKPMRNSAPGS